MKKYLLLGFGLACTFASHAYGRQNHLFFTGTFNSGREVTKACIECHEKDTKAFMKTVHWTWGKKQTLNGKSVEHGKKNALGNFYSALPSNWQGCTNCHPSYGWTDNTFDFGKAENIDCLVCHETTGTYKKFPSPAGDPLFPKEAKEAPKEEAKGAAKGEAKDPPKVTVPEPVDLLKVARSVERPNRAACGACHFYGCGDDGMKHGDLDSSLAKPTPEIDIHMGGKGMTCESCHKGASHDVKGEAVSVSLSSAPRAMGCSDCHKGAIHKSAALNFHIRKVACQTCHIPTFARALPTLTSWDWSSAGKDLKPEEIKKDANGKSLYEKEKGDLTWGKNLVPTLMWYNGSIDRVVMGDKIDPKKVVWLSAPKGDRKDPEAKIFPFKVMKGKQPYDAENMTVAVVNVTGPATSKTALTVQYDWNRAIEAGMKAAGQPYSGKYGWIETSTVWSLNHMVAPKDKALTCPDCHMEQGGRIDWKGLGYSRDPR